MAATDGQICDFLQGMKPVMVMVGVQVATAGLNIFYKLAATARVSLRVIVAYRFILCTAFMAPLAFFVERGKRPKLTWTVLFQAFLCGLFGGSLGQNLYLESLSLTSATFAAAMANLVPALTFIFAISFRLEKLGFGTMAGKAKVMGTVTGIGGAMLLTFYKGCQFDFSSINFDLLNSNPHVAPTSHSHKFSGGDAGRRGFLGALSALGSCCCSALWLIVQAKMNEKCPCQYTSTALMSSMGSIQAILIALCVERDWTQWKLGWNIKLWTIIYSGIVGSGIVVTLMSWCIKMRGPFFVSVFNPLALVLIALAGALFLDEKLYLGSLLGAILIICGLYMVLWGKSQEMKMTTQLLSSGTSSLEQNKVDVIVASPPGTGFISEKDIVSTEDESKEQGQ